MIKNEKITVNISYRNVTHYLKLGYNAILNQSLEINVSDLPSVSHVKIEVICSLCDCVNNIMYCKYIDNVNRHGFYGCRKCSREKFKMTYIDNGGGSWIDKTNIDLIKALESKNTITLSRSEGRYEDIYDRSYQLYKNEVRRLTKKNISKLLEIWDGKDYYDGQIIDRSLNHTNPDSLTVDHKTSIYHGYKNDILPYIISDIGNLCITKRCINSSKREFTITQ